MGEKEAIWDGGEEQAEAMVVEEEGGVVGIGGQGEEEGDGGVMWGSFLPRVSVRVLLVESDDSTRQIISALLRKCNYRVSAASDGLKAWEILKEKSHNIDLVLTEVDLPSISGFALLTMIMDHETCKNIPVIMMSSNDSISMVFKCMLKGAADFLVKPIRKNELRNLWQHIWRKHILNGQHGGTHEHQDENMEKEKMDSHSREYETCTHENKECSEKGSDAQSSCTRLEMEDDSTCLQNILDIKQPKGRDNSLLHDTVAHNEHHILSESGSLMQEGEAEELTPFNGACKTNEPTLQQDPISAVIETMNEDKRSKEIIDLIGVIDNQPRYGSVQGGTPAISNASEILVHAKDVRCKSSSLPHLELSLRRYQHSSSDKTENDEWNALNHSNSSAFSLYNSTAMVPTLMTMRSETERKEHYAASRKPLKDQGSGNTTNAPYNGQSRNMNMEGTDSLGLGLTSQGMTVESSPLRVMPFPIQIGEMASDKICAGYGTAMQPIYYPQAALPMWSTVPSTWQEAILTNSSQQRSPKDLNFVQSDHQDGHCPKSVIQHPAQKEEEIKELGDEQRYVSSVTGECGSSSVGRSHVNVNGSGNLCYGSKGNGAASISEANNESGTVESQFSCEGIKPIDFHRLNQREAALSKFRLKRKERCFEKKVRYHSRKRLAEQRPRVKGQFVRQAQADSQSIEAGCYHHDSASG